MAEGWSEKESWASCRVKAPASPPPHTHTPRLHTAVGREGDVEHPGREARREGKAVGEVALPSWLS